MQDKRHKYASSHKSSWSSSGHGSSHGSSRWGGHGTSLDDDHLMAGNTTICHWSTMGRESDEVLEKEISDKVTSDWKAIYRLELHNSSYLYPVKNLNM